MTSEQKQQLRAKIDLGLKASIARALEDHARAGRTVTIWRDGRTVQVIPPMRSAIESMVVQEEAPEA